MANGDSVTQWINDLKQGDEIAARRLWERYFVRLAGLARKRLEGAPRLPVDGEDLALSAFHCMCEGVERGRFDELRDRDGLWKLLVAITARKAREAVRDESRIKRGKGQVSGDSALLGPGDAEAGTRGLEQFLSEDPSPAFMAEMSEEYHRLLDVLPDPELREIAVWKMEGYTSREIADRLGKALATIERRLKLIRSVWTQNSE